MINKVILVGNVGVDPEIRTLESGVKVARVRLATTEHIYNPATKESREHTEWHNVTLWRHLADLADRYIRTGSQLYIEGRLRSRSWEDESGNTRYAIDILGDEVKLLGRRPDSVTGQPLDGTTHSQQRPQSEQRTQQESQEGGSSVADEIDDLPF